MNEIGDRGVSDREGIDDIYSSGRWERTHSTHRILSAVANEQRRAILDSLRRAPEKTLEFEALVDSVADMIQDEVMEEATDEYRQRARILLHHAHLPKLAEAGMIEYEAETDIVRFVGGELEQDLLTLVESHGSTE